MIAFGIAGVLILLVAVVAIGIYNSLVAKRERYKNSFAQIDVQLKRRYDLIPNLVSTAERALQHEKETLENVARARSGAMSAASAAAAQPGDPQAMAQLGKAESLLSMALRGFTAVSERYPELKGNQLMSQLFEELTGTENKVAFARQAFNDMVMDYNTARLNFPAVIFAPFLGFKEAGLLEVVESAEERQAPKVNFKQ